MQYETISFLGWNRCVRLTNSVVDLILTTEVGPRIMYFGLRGGPNVFSEYEDQVGKTGGDEWRIYGGHRLWHAPEMKPRTYQPDNGPVDVSFQDSFVRVTQLVEAETGIQKEMDISLYEEAAAAQVVHRLVNRSLWPLDLSVWALSAMAPGGTAILPMPPRAPHSENIAPANTLTLWTYTDLSDSRWTIGPQFILLHYDESISSPQKIGAAIPDGWAAFAIRQQLFVKQSHYFPGAVYPDGGCNVETFTNPKMTELETLGPLTRIEPGEAVEHTETWHLFDGVPQPATEKDVLQQIVPRVEGLIKTL